MTEIWESVYEKENAVLENIEKAEAEMWKVKSKEFENTLKPVVMQCNDILRHIASTCVSLDAGTH